MLPRRPTLARPTRGQSLIEFALVLPVLLILVGGIVQYGVLFAAKHSLIEVGRDVGRWAATQQFSPCDSAASASPPQPLAEADLLARQSHLIGYTAGDWNSANFTVYADNASLSAAPPDTEGVEVLWTYEAGQPCPPIDSTNLSWVTIRLSHRAPVLLPGFPYLPGLGTCDSSGCYFVVTTTARFRMEAPDSP
jgi:hypothetical protein